MGEDLREGKPTLPLIRVMQVGTPEEQALIRQAIETGEADFDAVAAAIKNTDALEYTREIAVQEAQIALDALDKLPDSIYKTSLRNFCTFAIERDR